MDKPFFLALDFRTLKNVQDFIEGNDLYGVPVKVGMELFYREGSKVIEWLKEYNHPIFLDLKLHDIPTTVEKAMYNLANLGVDIVNVHASGGSEMIKAAKKGLEAGAKNGPVPKLITVTVLTSMSEVTLQNELYIDQSVQETVAKLAFMSKNNGADGVVCSAHEVPSIKESCGKSFLTITPGIRLDEANRNDQKRVATPAFAKQNGADYLVIGRSITKAEDPKANYNRVIEEWNNA